MSAAGRLWRRAPLWRLSIGSAMTFAVLTALYPSPPLERVLASLLPNDRSSRADASVAIPSMVPTRRTLMPLAGRILALPDGDWHEVMAGRFEPHSESTEIILARLQRGKLTGLIDADATTGPSDDRPGLPQACLDPTDFAAHTQPGGQACWLVARTQFSALGPNQRTRTIGDVARDRLAQSGVEVPASMTRAAWFRVDGSEIMDVIVDLPDARPDRVEAWLRNWTPLLEAGFQGTLKAAQITGRLARDPAIP